MSDFMTTDRPSILKPNRDQMLAHLTALFGSAMKGQIELAWSEADDRKVNQAQLFDTADLDAIADRAYAINSQAGQNVYIGMATRLPSVAPFGRANDEDYMATYAVAVDLDAAGAVDAAKPVYEALNLRPSFAVVTGEKPHRRAQLWWKLDEPFTNAAIHREIQTGLAARFDGDPTIVNPSRVMRLAGSIAWPKKAGRETELTAFYPASNAEFPAARLLAVAREAVTGIRSSERKTAETHGLGLETYQAGADIDALIRNASVEGQWHDSVMRLTASLVGRGMPDSAILAMAGALTMPGYTVGQTVSELETMIRGARGKGWTPQIAAPQPAPVPMTEAEREEIPALMFKPWEEIDPRKIPLIRFVYSDFYAAGYTSVTVAPPKVGKSLLALAEAVDIASGRGILTGVPREPQPVVYFNAEDDQSVLDNRVIAACQHYSIPQSEIVGRLHVVSGVELDDFYFIDGDKPAVINERLFVGMEKFCQQQGAAALIFDPLQDLSRSPETNEVFRPLGQRLRRFAASTGVAVGLVHHTRKMAPGVTPTIDDARGGGALRGTSRFIRLLVSMSEDEAAKAGIKDHRWYFRIVDAEANLAPPSADMNRWFYKENVSAPNGQAVGVVTQWQWPDAFSGITTEDARRVRAVIDAQNPPARYSPQAAAWAGYVIAEALRLNPDDAAVKSRMRTLIEGWVKEDVLRVTEDRDAQKGRQTRIVICGSNALTGSDY